MLGRFFRGLFGALTSSGEASRDIPAAAGPQRADEGKLPDPPRERDPDNWISGFVKVEATGRGRRSKFTAMVPFTCPDGHDFELSAFGLREDTPLTCPSCGATRLMTLDEEDEVSAELEDALCDHFDDQGLDEPEGDDWDFLVAHGRFPKASERPAVGYPVGLVGEEYRQAAVKACKPGEKVTLYREPGNPHDPLAISVVCRRGETLGYIPRDNFVQRVVHEDGKGCDAKVWRLNKGEGGGLDVVLDVEICDDPLGERQFRR